MKIGGQRRNRSVFCDIKCHIVPRRRHGIIVKPAKGKEGLGYIGSMSEPMDCSSSGTHARRSTTMSDRDITPFGTARSRPSVPAHDHDPCTSRPQNRRRRRIPSCKSHALSCTPMEDPFSHNRLASPRKNHQHHSPRMPFVQTRARLQVLYCSTPSHESANGCCKT